MNVQQTLSWTRQNEQFFASTFAYFGLALLISGVGAYLGLPILALVGSPIILLIGATILMLVMMFTAEKWTNVQGLNILLFIVFALLGGLTLMPILALALASEAAMIIAVQAFASSAGLFLLMGLYGWSTKHDLTKVGMIAFFALIAVIIASIINIFLGSSLLAMATSAISIILFSIFIAWDIQSIKNGVFSNAMIAAIMLYIDFIGLFKNMFYIIWSFAGGSNE